MNFNSLNKIFEDKFTISKKLLREESSLKSKKEKSKKKLTESIDKNLTERDWKLTIPGSFRDDMLNAGEEEDFDKVKNILIDMCNYVLEHIDESNFDLDDQEYVIEEFEDFIEELEYVDFEDEDEANYYLNDLYDLLDNTDIFLGLRESLNEKLDYHIYSPLEVDEDEFYNNENVVRIKQWKDEDGEYWTVMTHDGMDSYCDGSSYDGRDSLQYCVDFCEKNNLPYYLFLDESLNESLPKEIKKDIDRIVKTHGIDSIPKWRIQYIAQDNPEYSKEIWNYVSDLEYPDDEELIELDESLNESSEKDLESGYYPDEWDIDFEDELENLGIEPQRGVYIGYQYRVPNRRFASKMVRLAKEFGYDDSWVEGNILYLKWSRPEREYHKTPYDESLNESWVLFFDEDGINHAGSDGAHKFNLSPKIIERKIKSSDYHLPNWAESYIILSDSQFHKMDYDEIEKYHKRYGKTLNEDTVKQDGKWVNKGKEGTHGTFKTKKEADAQRKAMFVNKQPGSNWGK